MKYKARKNERLLKEKKSREMIKSALIFLGLIVLIQCQTYVNRRNDDDICIYQRKVIRGPSKLSSIKIVKYPEVGDILDAMLITGVEIVDLYPAQNSKATILSGGVNYSFIVIALRNRMQHGFSYEIKLYGKPISETLQKN